MRQILTVLFFLMSLLANGAAPLSKSQRRAAEAEAEAVIRRFTEGKMPVKVAVSMSKDAEGRDRYSYEVKGGRLCIYASSGVAACRGFYDYVKQKGAGIASWSGCRFQLPADISAEPRMVYSPYRDHQYLNVVTYGYTAPYWDKERWDREIDWMALHGIDMPLVLLAQEQVYREVFRDMGLSDAEIDEWEVGPAHLPWMRMGNLAGNSFDGPLGRHWHDSQVQLCWHVMERVRALGMKPICPAFGGFVPKAFKKHYEVHTELTGWDWVPDSHRNSRLSPNTEAFAEVGARFIRKWEEKFGKGCYYLSDSFNEMDIPRDTALMTAYGDAVYRSISTANPDAVWVMQGWSLGYQRDSWGEGIFKALVKNVPDDKFLLLDMATDYNRYIWNQNYNWEFYEGFYGKQWLWSVIPNMGGKTAFTGYIDYYANGRMAALHPDKYVQPTGYGFAPEGLENNEMLYELIADAGWHSPADSIDLADWQQNYFQCRYGEVSPADRHYAEALSRSVYNAFQDHPQFAWQVRNKIVGSGNVRLNADFCAGVEGVFSNAESLRTRLSGLSEQGARLLRDDLVEAAAMYVSGKVEGVNLRIQRLLDEGDTLQAKHLVDDLKMLMLRLDRALTAHPLYNLEVWERQAVKVAGSDAERKRNAVNARRIVSVWYAEHEKDEPVNDYACRMWAGMIRDYYLPRLIRTWNRRISGTAFDQIAFENAFVNKAPVLSPQSPLQEEELPDFLCWLVRDAKALAQ